MERSLENADKSAPPEKNPSAEPRFEAAVAGACRELSLLLSQFAEVLSERAAADTRLMRELDGILTEARALEYFLREKKSHLRQALARITDKLQP